MALRCNFKLKELSQDGGRADFSKQADFLSKVMPELISTVPSNWVISSLEGKFGTVGDTFVLVLEPLFMKISNLCKNHL
jgi:hypothetical protein